MFLKEIWIFLIDIIKDYKNNSNSKIKKRDKIKCYILMIKNLLMSIFNGITAPIFYPIWYIFRKKISDHVYKLVKWDVIVDMMSRGEAERVKNIIKRRGKIYYFLWTYGDAVDPYGRGGLPKDYRNGKNNFINRFLYSAIRNPRFNYNYLYFITGTIVDREVIIDKRNFYIKHCSYGIGDSPDGIYFKWIKDKNNRWYFIYENNNYKRIFYFGYTGLLYIDVGNFGRFEVSYRKTKYSYIHKRNL